MSRTFGATTAERIVRAYGSSNITPPATLLYIVRRTAESVSGGIFANDNNNDFHFANYVAATPDDLIHISNDTVESTSVTIKIRATDGWVLAGSSKAAGTVAPRFHKLVYGTGVWLHENSGTTLADWTAAAGGAGSIGNAMLAAGFANSWQGEIAAVFLFNRVLPDAEIEAIAHSLPRLLNAGPVGAWVLNQPSVGVPVPDRIDASNQTAISGTAVSLSEPENFNYGQEPYETGNARPRAGEGLMPWDYIDAFDMVDYFTKKSTAGGATPVAAADAGAGTEATSTTAAVPSANSGAGTETTATTGSVTSSESASGSEAVSTTATVGPSENGAGSEATSTLAVVGLTDSATGSEATSTTAAVPSSNSGAGSETTTTTAAIPASDSGVGTEATSILYFIFGSDSAVGTETTTTTGSVTASDSGGGTEATSVAVTYFYSDSGSGTETTTTTASTTVTESGSGSEAVSTTALVGPSENGAGSEATNTLAVIGLSDSGTSSDSTSVTAVVSGADAGAGSESTSVTQPGVDQSITSTDAGAGSETASVQKPTTVVTGGAGVIFTRPLHRIRPLAQDRQIAVTDIGRGNEIVLGIRATITTSDLARGSERYLIATTAPSDFGRGIEATSIRKVETAESLRASLLVALAAGAITEEEFILIEEMRES